MHRKSFQRPDYQAMKRVAKANDWIICTEVDSLGRRKEATLNELQYYKSKNIRVMILEIPTTLIEYHGSWIIQWLQCSWKLSTICL